MSESQAIQILPVLRDDKPYIVYNDLPKIENLERLFPDAYRPDPQLIAAARPSN